MSAYSDAVLADSPLLYLRLDETSGATCANSGSLGGNATANGTYTRNVTAYHANLGVAVTLQGSGDDDYIAYPDTAALDLTGDFTYECWAKTGTSGSYYLISKGRDSPSVSGYAVTLVSNALNIRAGGTNVLSSAGGTFPIDSNWHHVVATRSGNNWALYVDGVSVATTTSSQANQATAKPLLVGVQQTEFGFQNGFLGSVDEVAVYSTALSSTTVAAHYAAATAAGTSRVTATRTLQYSVAGTVASTRALAYSVLGRITATRTLLYSVGGGAVSTRTLAYHVSQSVSSSMHLQYAVSGRVAATRTLRYQIVGTGRVASTRTLMWGNNGADELQGRFCIAFNATAMEWDEAIFTRMDDPELFPGLVTSYTIDRGRQYELDRTDTGRATVTIADQHGILNPRNPDGPFYNQLRPLLQACINRYNPTTGAWRTRFRGYIEDLSYSFDPSQRVNRLTLTLVDQFEILAAIEMQPGRFGSGTNTDGQVVFQRDGVQNRIVHILDDAGFQPHSRVIFSGNVILQKQPYSAGESPMTVIQEAADGEFPGVSNVYCDRKGRLCFHGRFAKFDPDRVAAGASIGAWDFQRWRVGDGAAVHGAPGEIAQVRQFGFTRGLSKIINVAVATPNNMDEVHMPDQLVEDLASTAVYGIRSWSATNLVTYQSVLPPDFSDARTETRRFASYYVENYSQPRDRVEGVVLRALRADDPRAEYLWKLLTEVDISDAVAVTVESPGGGGFESESYFVEGVHEQCQALGDDDLDDVTLTLDLSPEAYFDANPWPDADGGGG